MRFRIELRRISGAWLVDCRIKTSGREFPHLNQQLPRPVDRLLFKIISEGPVSQHLEKGVVIGIKPYVFQIVMFPTRPNTLLRVSRSCRRMGKFSLTQKNRDKLIHPRIGEEQIRRSRHQTGRGHDRMALPTEELQEPFSDFSRFHRTN